MALVYVAFPKGDFGEEDILQLNILYMYFRAYHPTRERGR